MVVEEESPPKASKRKIKRNSGIGMKVTSPRVMEESEDEDEDELSDEEDTYDIDDSSAEAESIIVPASQPTREEFVGREKIPIRKSVMSRRSKSRSRSRLRNFASGYDSPGRFASSLSHPPIFSPRHVEFDMPSPSKDSSPTQSSKSDEAQRGSRDDIRSPQPPSGKSRIPKDRDLDLEFVKTPTPIVHGRARGHSRTSEHHEHRAFAVWGHDESDSNPSDSEA